MKKKYTKNIFLNKKIIFFFLEKNEKFTLAWKVVRNLTNFNNKKKDTNSSTLLKTFCELMFVEQGGIKFYEKGKL